MNHRFGLSGGLGPLPGQQGAGEKQDPIVFEKNDPGGRSGRRAQEQDGRHLWWARGSEGEGKGWGWQSSVQTLSLRGLCQEKGLGGGEQVAMGVTMTPVSQDQGRGWGLGGACWSSEKLFPSPTPWQPRCSM